MVTDQQQTDSDRALRQGGWCLLMLPLIAAGILVGGYVMRDLWAWFVVPLGVAPIGFWQACGMRLLAGYLAKEVDFKPLLAARPGAPKSERESPEEAGAKQLWRIAISISTWCFGAVYACAGG